MANFSLQHGYHFGETLNSGLGVGRVSRVSPGFGNLDGRDFGGPGFVRLNFGCPRVTLLEALSKMKEAMEARAGTGR